MEPHRHTRGGSFYDQPGVLDEYLAHRHSFDRSPNIAMEEPAFLSELGDIEGQRLLDLGCGDAVFAREAISRGASAYVGVDGSAEMVRRARRDADDPRVSVFRCDIEELAVEPRSFDVVVSRMALHYVENLHATLERVADALQPDGRLIFSVVHPVITSSNRRPEGQLRSDHVVDRYFERGARHREWFGSSVTWFHRTTEDYVAALESCGLRLVSLRECEPDRTVLRDRPDELQRRRRVPLMLLLSAELIGAPR